MGIRYEAWTLPWLLDFKRKVAKLPDITGSGSGSIEFLSTGGESSVDLSLGEKWDRLDEVISDVEGSLIRVYDKQKIIDEWIAERINSAYSDNNKIASISGGQLVSVLDKYIVFPYDDLNPPLQADWIWGAGINSGTDTNGGLIDNPGFENLALPNGGFEDGNTGHWEETQGGGGAANIFKGADLTAVNNVANADSGNWYGVVNNIVDKNGGVRYPLSGLTAGKTYFLTGKLKAPISGGRYRAGVSDAIEATHTNAYEEDGYWWAEVDNVAAPNGTSDGTWQDFTVTFKAASSAADLVIVWADAGAGNDFWIDTWSGTGFGLGLEPWTPATGVGIESSFGIEYTNVRSGVQSCRVQGDDYYFENPYTGGGHYGGIGISQATQLEVGKVYTATTWIRQNSGSTHNFVMIIKRRTSLGEFGSQGSVYMATKYKDVPTGVWTKLERTFTADASDIYFEVRYRYTGAVDSSPHPSPTFYVDDNSLFEGFPATTAGDMFTQVLDAAVDRGVLDWIDYSSFDKVNDSNGNPWTENIGLTIQWGQSFGQVLDQFVDLNYEWEFSPKATPVGTLTHNLRLFLPGGADDLPAVAINAKAGVTGGNVLHRVPDYTTVIVEGAGQAYSEVTDATATTNFGRLEEFIANRLLTDEATRVQAGTQYLAYEEANRNAISVELFENTDHKQPWVDYKIGDSIYFQFPLGGASGQITGLPKTLKRVQRIEYNNDYPARFVITGSRVLDGEAAAYDLVRRMWRRFNRPPDLGGGGAGAGAGGNAPTVVVACENSTSFSQARADFIASTANAHVDILVAILSIQAIGGRVLLTEGTFNTAAKITVPDGVTLEGLGRRTHINASVAGDWAVEALQGGNLERFDVTNPVGHGARITQICV